MEPEPERMKLPPHLGTSGRRIQLVANFVPLSQQPDLCCAQYHVEFEPQVESKSFRHQILKQERIQEHIGTTFIFDGMILYTVNDRNFEVNDFYNKEF
ncbi:hypothetical protein NECAME_04915 [Necator americanus]|uniref:Uncharacterized protein n=1 Tax=Necator americanus TaxID=51031 RepID=W2SP61_NECAM|nr:hypothetical protein NECAME_04915 [Necator americanus]ETN70492.1 hypothetical protein NECAME_04915 [Necator americanus]